jgi:carbon storage regulator
MLVLTRKQGEQIVVPECGLTVTVLGIAGTRVRVGIAAPPNVTIRRAEILERERGKSRAPQGKD